MRRSISPPRGSTSASRRGAASSHGSAVGMPTARACRCCARRPTIRRRNMPRRFRWYRSAAGCAAMASPSGAWITVFAPNTADPLYLHGDGWLGTWEVERQDDTALTLAFAHRNGAYDYEARQTFALAPGLVSVDLSVVNRGAADAVRPRLASILSAHRRYTADGALPFRLDGRGGIPTRGASPAAARPRFRGRRADPGSLDQHFARRLERPRRDRLAGAPDCARSGSRCAGPSRRDVRARRRARPVLSRRLVLLRTDHPSRRCQPSARFRRARPARPRRKLLSRRAAQARHLSDSFEPREAALS